MTDNISREELKAKIDRGDEFVDEAESLLPDEEADISFPKHKLSELEVPRISDRGRY